MNNKGLIIFDFDGTLGDTRKTIVTTMQMTIRELQLPDRSEAACASTIGLPLAGCFMGIAETITYLIGADYIIDRIEDLLEIVAAARR